MLRSARRHVTYANVTSTVALVIALSAGTAYAASQITGRQIAKHTITADNIKPHTLTAATIKSGVIPSGKPVASGYVTVNAALNPVIQHDTGFKDGVSKPASTTGLYCLALPTSKDVDDPAIITAATGEIYTYGITSNESCPDPKVDLAVQAIDEKDDSAADINQQGSGFEIVILP